MMKRGMSVAFLFLVASGCAGTSPGAASTGELKVQSFTSSEKSNDVTSTLIVGEKEAMLVDAQFIDSDAKRLVTTIQATGRHLSTIYVTHAHPDHHFGLAVLHAAFPDARVLAHPSVAAEMKATWKGKHDQWKSVYADDLTDTEVDATPYAQSSITLEGHEIRLLGPAEGDTPHDVSVYVPELGALAVGDASYSGTHVWLADTKPAEWDAWVTNLQSLKALQPTTVVSGHRATGRPDAATDLDETIQYIEDFKAAVAASKSADEVISAMMKKYPDRALPLVLQLSAKAAFGG